MSSTHTHTHTHTHMYIYVKYIYIYTVTIKGKVWTSPIRKASTRISNQSFEHKSGPKFSSLV